MAQEIPHSHLTLFIDVTPTVQNLADYLTALYEAYNGIFTIVYEQGFLFRVLRPGYRYGETKGEHIAPINRLTISRIVIQSPGFVDVVGLGVIVKELREYLKDRHERRKDRKWKEATEREKAALESQLLAQQLEMGRLELIKQTMNVLRDAGLTPEEVRQMIWVQVGLPLSKLGEQQDKGLISGIE